MAVQANTTATTTALEEAAADPVGGEVRSCHSLSLSAFLPSVHPLPYPFLIHLDKKPPLTSHRPQRPRTLGLCLLGPVERVVDALRLALCPVDCLVGWQRVPRLRLAGLDSRSMEHCCALDDVVRLYGEYHGDERGHGDHERCEWGHGCADHRVWAAGCGGECGWGCGEWRVVGKYRRCGREDGEFGRGPCRCGVGGGGGVVDAYV